MRLVDLEKLIAQGHAAGARVAVDNTFLSPALQNPIKFGADFVVHSTTKYINGHSDVIGGALVCTTPEDVTTHRWWANALGSTAPAFDSYMTLRGIRTLFVRIRQQQQTAETIAGWLEQHPAVTAGPVSRFALTPPARPGTKAATRPRRHDEFRTERRSRCGQSRARCC
ncbi:MAG: PLP-dependent transferase [Asticcacaulis sp.]